VPTRTQQVGLFAVLTALALYVVVRTWVG